MFTLQILHASDLEGGLEALDNAPNFAAVVGALEDDAAAAGVASILISAGDNYIPGPFYNAGGDGSLRDVFVAAMNEIFGLVDASAIDPAADADGDGFFTLAEIDAFLTEPGQTVTASEVFVTDVNGDGFSDHFAELEARPGGVDLAIMAAMGFDASAVGNHEFDAGTGPMEDLIETEREEGNSLSDSPVSALVAEQPGHENYLQEVDWFGAQFPYLSANLDFAVEGDLAGLFTTEIRETASYVFDLATARDDPADPAARGSDSVPEAIAPSAVITVDGETVGLVGATTQRISRITSNGDAVDETGGVVDMPALAAELQPEIDALVATGVNKIVLVTHLQQIALEKELAGLLSGVDVIIAGGSDTLQADGDDRLRDGDTADEGYPFETVNADGEPVMIVSTDGEYSYVGRLTVEFDADGVVIPTSTTEANSGAYATDDQGVIDLGGGAEGGLGVTLSEAQEAPPVADGPATGAFDFHLVGSTLVLDGTYGGMTGDLRDVAPGDAEDAEGNPIDGAHIHVAAAGSNGPVVRALSVVENGGGSGRFFGEFDLTASEIADLRAGNFYVNLHTDANPGGELRGQFPAEADFVTLPAPFEGAAATVASLTDAVRDVVTARDGDVSGETDVFLNGERADVRTQETNLGNLSAEANLAAAQAVDSSITVSIKNGGGIRAPIGEVVDAGGGAFSFEPPQANPLSGKAEGEVSRLDIENSLRFDNGLSTVQLTPQQLKQVLEHAVADTAPGATPGQFAQVAGLAFSFDPTATAQILDDDGNPTTPGERIRTITLTDIDGAPTQTIFADGAFAADAPASIGVVTLDFLAGGGDGYPFSNYGAVTDLGIGEQDALYDHMSEVYVAGDVIARAVSADGDLGVTATVNDAPVFSSPGDGFQVFQRGVDSSIPFAVLDDSDTFGGEDQGIVATDDTDPFFGIVDTVNGDTSGPVSASWTFDVSGAANPSLFVDVAAMGDFEDDDSIVVEVSVDGGAFSTAFELVADEDGEQTYTLEDGDAFTLNDPMTIGGATLSNAFETFSAALGGAASEATVRVTASVNGGSEAVALRDVSILDVPASAVGPFAEADLPAHEDTRIVNLAERSDALDLPMPSDDVFLSRVFQYQGESDPDDEDSPEGASEVVAHENGELFITNGNLGRVDVVGAFTGKLLRSYDLTGLEGYAGVQSLAVADGVLAVAIERDPVDVGGVATSQPGFVSFHDAATGALLSRADVGDLPDAVAFTPDGRTLVVAGEGEFNDDSDYEDDPLGTIGVIDVSDPAAPSVTLADFTAFDGTEDALRDAGVRVKAVTAFSLDAEPEYVAISPDGGAAFVTLQENNAVAVLDLATATVTDVIGLGARDFGVGNGFDPLDDGTPNIRVFEPIEVERTDDATETTTTETVAPVVGLYMPDAMSAFETGGETYLITANEGDSRDFDEDRVGDLVEDGALDAGFADRLRALGLIDDDADTDVGLERLEVLTTEGDLDGDGDIDQLTAFSTRGFTIWDTAGEVVFDSGDLAETYLAATVPDRFNDDDGDDGEDRSDAKGPEFEAVEIGEVNGRTLAFVGAERDSGVFVFDVTDPTTPDFLHYVDGFENEDRSPEIIEFIAAEDSATGLPQVAVSYEVSGTTSVFDVLPAEPGSIGALQGARHVSAYEGRVVEVSGVVTALDTIYAGSSRELSGFYVQDVTGDGDDHTSDAIFVASDAEVAVGDAVTVSGRVGEQGFGLTTTYIGADSVAVDASGAALPAATVLGAAGRTPPTERVISDDELPADLNETAAGFDPEQDGVDFYESLEGMLVTVDDPIAISPTNRFDETWVLADGGAGATPGLDSRNGLPIDNDAEGYGDLNPERIQLQFDPDMAGAGSDPITQGARLEDATGIVGYDFGNYEVKLTETAAVAEESPNTPETVAVRTAGETLLRVASYNVLNHSATAADDDQRARIAAHIVDALDAPDILGLQEIQDNSGDVDEGGDDGTLAADQTLQRLVDAIAAAGGPTYAFASAEVDEDGETGGVPGGNIRNAFLYDPTRVSLVEEVTLEAEELAARGVAEPDAFNDARARDPHLGLFRFGDEAVTVVNNHFESRSGSDPIFGDVHPFEQGGEASRAAQARAINAVVDSIVADDAEANVVVLGDFNTFENTDEMTEDLQGGADPVLINLQSVAIEREFSYNFQGNSQNLDHVFATEGLASVSRFDVVNVNDEFVSPASDHDPILATFNFAPDRVVSGGEEGETVRGGAGDDEIAAGGGNDRVRGFLGDDSVDGGTGRDFVTSGRGDDEIDGAGGWDLLIGRLGDDTLVGRDGRDVLIGGRGEDTFVAFRGDRFADVLFDFEVGVDTLELRDFGPDAALELEVQEARTLVGVDGERVAIVNSDDFAAFTQDDVLFV